MAKKPTYEELEHRVIELEQETAEREQVEEELKRSQELLKEAEAIGHVGSWEHDSKTKRFTLSEGVCHIFGASPGTFQPTHEDFLSRIYPDDRDKVVAVISDTIKKKGASLPVDYRIQWPDGSLHWVRSTKEMFCDEAGEPIRFVGVVQDITESKESELALRQSEERFREMAENIRDVFWLFDWKEQRVLYANPAYEQIWGRPVEDLYNRYAEWGDSIHPDDLSCAEESFARIVETGGGEPRQYRIIRPDGAVRWISDRGFAVKGEDGQIHHIVGIAEDITEHKQAGDALLKSEQRYRQLFEQSRDAIGVTTREGRFLAVNQATLDLYGYTEEEMLALDVNDLYVNALDREKYLQELEQNGSVKDYEVKLFRKDGKPLDILLTTTLWRDDDGNIIGYQGINRDITHQRNLEAQLLQAQKMESIGTLAGGIAHSFNNLLMAIQGYASLMSLDIDDEHPHSGHLKGIEKTVKRSADLTSQLMGFARKGKYAVKPTDLNSLVLESSQMFGRTNKELKVSCQCQEDIWPVEVDRGQIEQMLLSLYVNASQAIPEGGDLSLQTENVVLDETYVKPFQVKPGKYVKIAVTDTGMGMDEKTKMQIFDPFFTTKGLASGTGLGLSSAYGIVKNHGGIIDVQSAMGKGTTFTIYLPATEKTIPEEKKVAKEVLKGEGAILLVDDEDLIIEVGSKILKALGYTVEVARGGKEAIARYHEKRGEIALVILDMVMPDMGGGETYDQLKGIDPNVKVLLASGYSIDGQATEILERGCDGFIQKPFNMKQLSEKIREILGKG